MKKLYFLKTMLLLCALVAGSGSVWADADYTFALASGDFTSSTHSKTVNSIQWTHTHGDGTESYGWDDTYGFKFGSSNSSYPTSFTLTSSAFSNKIKKVVVKASVNSKKSCKLDVKVGTTTYGSQVTINTKNNETWEFSIADASTVNGAIELSFSSSTGPLYLKEIEVYYHNVVNSLSVKTAPTKTRYEVGETLDMTGFVLNADGNDVSSGYTMTMGGSDISNGATLNSVGKKTITVAYGGKETTQDISVGSAASIAVTTAPTKISYNTGDSFDPTGMVVTATMSTGEETDPDTWTKEVTGYTIDPEEDLAPANTYVTITYATKTATQTISVSDVAVTGISLKASTTIEKGKTETLTPTFAPTNATNKTVTWESDNTAVATVSSAGVITAVAVGTANITVTTEDGDYTATCIVTVVNQKGGKDAPYTIAEVKNGDASGKTDIWVKGYIVGCWANNSFTNENLNNTNLALADNIVDKYSVSNTIAVELTEASGFRTSWGPSNNSYNVNVAQVLIKGNGQNYFGTYALKGASEIEKVAERVNISSAGMATYYTDCALDFSEFTDMYAYTAAVSGDKVNFSRVNKVPANTAVLLRNPDGAIAASHDVPVTDSPESVTSDLTGTLTNIASLATTSGSNTNYILNTGDNGVGFYYANGLPVGMHKAYLTVTAGARTFIGFDNETDGIDTTPVNSEERTVNVYDLQGRKVNSQFFDEQSGRAERTIHNSQLKKGLYIVNGKKVIK